MATIVTRQALEAAAECVSTDKFRPQLQSVFVDGTGLIAATDGHLMIEIEPCGRDLAEYPAPANGLGEAFNGEGILIPAASAKAAAKAAPRKAVQDILRDSVLVISRGGGSGEAFSTDLDAQRSEAFRAAEGPFPNYRAFIPADRPDALVIRFNLPLILRLLGAMLKAASGSRFADVDLTIPADNLKPLRVDLVSENAKARGLVMPVRRG